jgi:hypothetical protein
MDLEMEFQFDNEKCAKALFFSFDPIEELNPTRFMVMMWIIPIVLFASPGNAAFLSNPK